MLSVKKTIKNNRLVSQGERIGIAVSGGMDSMSLLHFLNSEKKSLGIEVIAINIDHGLRENSHKESLFVRRYCRENEIEFKKIKLDVLTLIDENKLSIEEAARHARYGAFDKLIKENFVNKIALGHHASDQAETVLLNLFRGTGLTGASGMGVRRDKYIRPMLFTKKIEVENYVKANKVKYVVDESNLENEFSRNYLRNVVMPLIKERFKGAENNLVNFSKVARQDDEYIEGKITTSAIIYGGAYVKVPVTYFLKESPVVNRLLKHCFKYLGVEKDIERKHLSIIKSMVKESVNGIKINLPNKITVHKEYDYITIIAKAKRYKFNEQPMKSGEIVIKNFGKITIKRTYDVDPNKKDHIVDVKKVPKGAVWRNRQEGDVFTKFGGGTKKLKDYLIDKKVPKRLRDSLPVLAIKKEVLIVAGYDISEKLKIDPNTKSAYVIKYNIKEEK